MQHDVTWHYVQDSFHCPTYSDTGRPMTGGVGWTLVLRQMTNSSQIGGAFLHDNTDLCGRPMRAHAQKPFPLGEVQRPKVD